ncbi:MAG: glycosyltransferase family 4 protein, partial [Candidatus Kapabacteria bacterium]|nr:glycosyltransferase family 4 protein [Candidatus Kapabacteria bacterium]
RKITLPETMGTAKTAHIGNMKILIISTFDREGGAAIAAFRLHQSLLECGVDSRMLVQFKKSRDRSVLGPNSRLDKFIALIKPKIDNFPLARYSNVKNLFSTNWVYSKTNLSLINKIKPDIVHIHWTNFGMFRIEDLAKINAPLILSMHDNWTFTGGCHYFGTCEKYKGACGKCPLLNSNRENDLSHIVFKRKKNTYSKIDNITFIGLSQWMMKCGKESSLLRDKTVINLPNTINTNKFKVLNKTFCRDIWNLPYEKTLILFGAINVMNDPRKGINKLLSALSLIKESNIELVIFGMESTEKPLQSFMKENYIGQISDESSLVSLYNACDVTAVPSLYENLSNVIMESLSCGTPVVAFDIGGNSDMIIHLQNGYLANPYDTKDLATGIEWVIKNNFAENLGNNAREKINFEFSYKIVSTKYIDLYKSILNSNSNS